MINIKISAVAFLKMQTLVAGYDHEVGWYGTAEKISDDAYRIMDILVYPQYASAAYIDDRDTTEMPLWFQSLSDEVYDHKRFHGHSHVSMSVYPSGTDKKTYDQFKAQNSNAKVNRFTIELIMNKKFEMYWKVYDAVTDKEYDNKEISVEIEITENETMAAYFEESKKNVRESRACADFLLTGVPTKVKSINPSYRKSYPQQTSYSVAKGVVIRIQDKSLSVKREFIHGKGSVIYDIYETPYKFENCAKHRKVSDTVLDSLLILAEEEVGSHFMIYDSASEKILSPDTKDVLELPVKDETVLSSKGLNIYTILV